MKQLGIREIVLLAVLPGMLGASCFATFNQVSQASKTIEADLAKRKKALLELTLFEGDAGKLNQRAGELKGAIENFDASLPKDSEKQSILSKIIALAEQNRMRVKTIKAGELQRGGQYRVCPVKIVATGEFALLYQYMQGLEQMPGLVRIAKLQVERTPIQGELNADLLLDVYFR